MQRIGSKEAGQKWSEITSAINTHADFTTMPRDQRSVRERFNKLLSDFNTKMQKEEKASGISPDDLSEVDQILEEIQEVITSNAISPCASSDKGKSESERAKALAVRNRTMTSWGKETVEDADEDENNKPRRKRSRRSGGDPLEYLKTEREAQMELKKEEMALRREQLMHQSIPAVPIPPRATAGHFLTLPVPGVGHLRTSGCPRAYDTWFRNRGVSHVFVMEAFIGQDVDYVAD